ncbi:hypothetical protein CDL12_16501 [Handroanthus impetiginosus]|uniref:Uncharacterized protein n=1 Tax=Handroanthus impetiginosus TaxID=429701 RepID=A0A2G9H041_9LAMI|nr:hypothetical protein CDL12_16501 [Handroanthus impetiginosus]
MATIGEDFTFPTTSSGSPPRFLDSPPLWRPNPGQEKQEKSKGKEVEDEEKLIKAKRKSKGKEVEDEGKLIKAKRKSPYHDHEDEDEEKMDMLWEDLNDESSRNSEKIGQKSDVCVKALKLSKANGKKNLSIVVFIKVLKKFFLMHNSHRTIKKRSW